MPHPPHSPFGTLVDPAVDIGGSDRRGFLVAAMLAMGGAVGAVAGLVGCDRSGAPARNRSLPSAIDRPSDPSSDRVELPESGGSRPQRGIVVERPLPPTSEPIVRVRIATIRPPTRRLTIQGDGARVYVGVVGGAVKAVATPAEIQATIDGWVVIESVGTSRAGTYQFSSQPLELRAVPGSRGIRFANDLAGNISWPFTIRCVHRTDEGIGAVDVVCHVAMESYLPGVLAKELYPNWSADAFLAQAVAARSYALCEMAQNANRHFDVVAGESSQAWIGYTTHRASLDGVRRTVGMSIVWDGRVVPAYYSSTCGGRPANATDAISDSAFNSIRPLMVSEASARNCCAAAPSWRWKMSLPTAETSKRVALWAKTERPAIARIDGIRAIEPATLNASGRPVSFRIQDSRKQVFEIPAERLRWAFNADVPGLAAVRSRVKSADLAAQVSAVAISLEGRGYGHGVGMCQYGAEAMSKSGSTWRDILRFYYPTSEVTQSYAQSSPQASRGSNALPSMRDSPSVSS
ncbi:MAG: SpoIID/LytB domain-containing protein [Phycisphaerae bacterium]|nr:SpoIID/LytB domain-containing protein [Phycisphaerae bacterium]